MWTAGNRVFIEAPGRIVTDVVAFKRRLWRFHLVHEKRWHAKILSLRLFRSALFNVESFNTP